MDYSHLTKEQIINGIKNNTILLADLSEQWKNDKEIVISFFQNTKFPQYSIERIPSIFNDDKEVALEVVKRAGWGIMFFSERLKDDSDVVLAVIKQKTLAFKYASKRLRNDKEIVLEAVKIDSRILQDVSERLQDDKEIVVFAIKNYVPSLQYASKRLQNDKEVLEILEKENSSDLYSKEKIWYYERMEFLANIREKELLEKTISPSNKTSKTIKF